MNFFFFPKIVPFVRCEKILYSQTHHTTIRCIACRIPKATNVHSEYVVLSAFPLQQRLQECASVLHYMYVACIVSLLITVMKAGPVAWSADLRRALRHHWNNQKYVTGNIKFFKCKIVSLRNISNLGTHPQKCFPALL